MPKTLMICAAAAALAFASSAAVAKSPPSSSSTNAATPATTAAPATPATPATTPATPATPATTGASSDTSANASASAPLAVGMQVKDNAGAEIGKIADLKADASGAQMATIQMGTDKFSVAASSIAVQNGAGVINLSKADILSKLHAGH
jgi:hypothetical protein